MKTITICTSVSFYRQAVKVGKELEALGYKVILPSGVHTMIKSGDFAVSSSKTWFENPEDYYKKGKLMMAHFKEIEKGDAVLVLNYEKHGTANYIGGNVLMEMGVGFCLDKPLFILNEVPKDSAFLEELLGFLPVELHGDLAALKKHL